jgi:hypothetical protein
METLEELGLEIAYPSTTVYLRQEDSDQAKTFPGKSVT